MANSGGVMARLTFNDSRTARQIEQMVTRRAREELANRVPQGRYATVLALDLGERSATLRFVRGGGYDDIAHVPMGDFTPRVGQRVRTIRWPETGDAYIERADGEDTLIARLIELGLLEG